MRLRTLLAAAALLAGSAGAAAAALPLVAIDPGHGGADSGAVGVLPAGTPSGLPPRADARGRTLIYEKDVTLDIARRLDAWLRARAFPTVMTRTQDLAGGDRPYTSQIADLRARVDVANRAGADLFVSIHENALSATSSGTETYHFYYAGAAARSLAVAVHQEVVVRLGLPDRGVKQAGFYVLKNTVMPAILLEGAFLSNPAEAALLARPDVRQRIAEGVGAGIVRHQQGIRTPPTGYGPPPRPAPLVIRYWVTAGMFKSRGQARARVAALTRRRVEAVIRSRWSPRLRRTMFYVVTGQYVFLQSARTDRAKVRALRFPARIIGAPARR
ncbi:MAG: N-acetylmuramoyl-L-alanine amidase [Thermoleophilia bacterium]|jgi:N-acetylmuramoyl-L-alanine amidase|nr:N-acetylmuramoyl-L-alanine amidase [Thermoleophilia bacterium]